MVDKLCLKRYNICISCGHSLMAEHQLPKLNVGVRFPLPA